MMNSESPTAAMATDAAPRTKSLIYPEPFASRMCQAPEAPAGRSVRSDEFRRQSYPASARRHLGTSALRHARSKQDEFIYILEGSPILITDEGETRLAPGMCAGFRVGTGNGHQLVNRTDDVVVFLEVGDRSPSDSATYLDDDLAAALNPDGRWIFTHKDGHAY